MCQVIAEIFNPFSNLMRNLSDNTSNTNTAKFANYNIVNKREWLNYSSAETAREARSKQEWRLALVKGDYIDAINFFETPYNH
jgi:methionine synthase I (cobalamin-dependent)